MYDGLAVLFAGSWPVPPDSKRELPRKPERTPPPPRDARQETVEEPAR